MRFCAQVPKCPPYGGRRLSILFLRFLGLSQKLTNLNKYLSILFLRFMNSIECPTCGYYLERLSILFLRFTPLIKVQTTTGNILSILFLRFHYLALRKNFGLYSFNSLFEILSRRPNRDIGSNRILSILFLRFLLLP